MACHSICVTHHRLQGLQTDLTEETDAACCYAKSDKYWVTDPQGIAWETFHTLDSIPVFGENHSPAANQSACCVPLAKTANKRARHAVCLLRIKTPAALAANPPIQARP